MTETTRQPARSRIRGWLALPAYNAHQAHSSSILPPASQNASRLTRVQILGWFAIGVVVAMFVMWAQANALGGWTAILNVGEDSDFRTAIDAQLSNLVTVEGIGHDGQITFAIALDPWGKEFTDLVPQPSHRWRRFVFPAVAGGFGTLSGEALFWSMIAWSAASLGAASVALRSILASLGASVWAMFGLLAHPGVWLGLRIMTTDPMALAFGLAGMALVLRRRDRAGIGALILAALTKEVYLLFAAGLGAWRFFDGETRRGLVLFGVPAAVFAVWAVMMVRVVEGTSLELENLSLPFAGVANASRYWPDFPARQNIQTALTVLILLAGVIVAFRVRSSLLRWSLASWLTLAVITSEWVWQYGNNSLRAFAPVGTFIAIALALPRRTTLQT